MAPSRVRGSTVEVVTIVASAGGLDALSIVLRDLPTEFPAAVVLQQHLGGHTSVLPTILSGRTRQRVGWAIDGQLLRPGEVIVCPPGMDMELLPDGSCRLHALEGIGVRRFDVLLTSMAGSYGARGVAVVLSGSGTDGAQGALAMVEAGATVIAQSPETAAYPNMPIAAAKAGAGFVMPIEHIGRFLAHIAEGGSLPRPSGELDSAGAFFAGPGEIRALLRQTNWTASPLGPLPEWPAELRILVRSAMQSGNPMAVWWGPDEVHWIENTAAYTWEAPQQRRSVQQVRVGSARLPSPEPEMTTVGVLFFRVEGNIVAVNDAFVQRSGYRHDELTVPMSFVDLAGDDFRAATDAVLRRFADVGAPYPNEMTGKNGWALCSPMVLGNSTDSTGADDDVCDNTAKRPLNTRLEDQFRALLRSVAPADRPNDSEGLDPMAIDPPLWGDFTGRRIDEWIGWGLVNAVCPALPVGQRLRRAQGAGRASGQPRAMAIPLHHFVARHAGQGRAGLLTPTNRGATGAAAAAEAARLRADTAAARAEDAGLRAAELRRRRESLAAGNGATAHTVATARYRAKESLRRAERARKVVAELGMD